MVDLNVVLHQSGFFLFCFVLFCFGGGYLNIRFFSYCPAVLVVVIVISIIMISCSSTSSIGISLSIINLVQDPVASARSSQVQQ